MNNMFDWMSDSNKGEIEGMKNLIKSEEEIAKYATDENFSELRKAIFLMRKGYEMQKTSVIQNLDRYMRESGAQKELFPIICESFLFWDEKMQKECANSFCRLLELNV